MKPHRQTIPAQTHGILILLAMLWSLAVGAAPAPAPPNVVLFLVDDMGWMDCGVYGSKYYETPNIDRFAQRAMRFTRAYAQPLCSPTRASILTGKYPSRHGILTASGHQPPQPPGHNFQPATAAPHRPLIAPQSKNYLDPAEYTLAEALRDAGYRTAHIGKWHLGLMPPHWPEQQGFDVAWHCHPDPGPPGNYFSPYGVTPTGNPSVRNKVGTITDGPPGEYIVDRQAEEALKFIRQSKGRPFFLNLWCYGVHGPWGHKEEYTKVFAKKTDPRGVQGNPIMASMLRSVDECFGRIVDELDRLGLTTNTIVIFYSDNGGNTHSNVPGSERTERTEKGKSAFMKDWRKWAGDRPPTDNTPLRDGKGTLYEGGTRVPMMWAWPGRIAPGTVTDALAGHIDLYPTLLELAGLPRPAQQVMDGVSLAPVLLGKAKEVRRAFFNYFPFRPNDGGATVVSGDFKLIRWFGPGVPRELYNLREDIGEAKNLAAQLPGKVKELDALIDDFLNRTGAFVPRPNPAYQPGARPANARNAATTDPLQGWKARQCEAAVENGVLRITAKSGAFLGHSTGRTQGPATVKLRVRSAADGTGKIEWLGDAGAGAQPQSVPYSVAAGQWREVVVEMPAKGLLGTTRLYLPAGAGSVELDWVELTAHGAKPQRWDFGGAAR
jgi:arylsulfatase A-like enzyme